VLIALLAKLHCGQGNFPAAWVMVFTHRNLLELSAFGRSPDRDGKFPPSAMGVNFAAWYRFDDAPLMFFTIFEFKRFRKRDPAVYKQKCFQAFRSSCQR